MRDTADAFIDVFTLDGAGDGPLRGLTFGAKDLFDVAGHITGCGSPDKAAAARPAAATAPAVTALSPPAVSWLAKPTPTRSPIA